MVARSKANGSNLSIILIGKCYKKPPRSPTGSRNSHINLKKRKIYTVRFYEDLTAQTNSRVHMNTQT